MSIDVEEQYDKIYRYCYFKLNNRQVAEDITQETFLRYFQRYDYVAGGGALKCLYTIARNLCIDEYRRRTRERTAEYACEDFIRGNDVCSDIQEEQIITKYTVQDALAELQEDEQELLLLRYVNEVPVSAIGQMLGISRFAVHRRLAAVQKKFKDILERKGGI